MTAPKHNVSTSMLDCGWCSLGHTLHFSNTAGGPEKLKLDLGVIWSQFQDFCPLRRGVISQILSQIKADGFVLDFMHPWDRKQVSLKVQKYGPVLLFRSGMTNAGRRGSSGTLEDFARWSLKTKCTSFPDVELWCKYYFTYIKSHINLSGWCQNLLLFLCIWKIENLNRLQMIYCLGPFDFTCVCHPWTEN